MKRSLAFNNVVDAQDVRTTLLRRHFNVLMSLQRRSNVMCWLGIYFGSMGIRIIESVLKRRFPLVWYVYLLMISRVIILISFFFFYSEICSSDVKIRKMITALLRPLAEAYFKLYNAQKSTQILIKHRKEEFFGMRDFYRFVDVLCAFFHKSF